ncbi:MAG TPA: tRNA (guanosine(37)-N1)-methyltransferase TrmD [Streptosporangiaceae bacterium]
MRIDIVTIFPEYFAPLDVSLLGKARQRGLLDIRLHDLRNWTHDRHRTVDDTPYGGGPGMVMKPEPWGEALDAIIGTGPTSTGSADAAVPQSESSAGADAVSQGVSDEPAAGGAGPQSVSDEPAAGGAVSQGVSDDSAADRDAAGPRLIVPTPSGRPFTQGLAQSYVREPWLVFACGRYEGIDTRVVEDARARMPVDEVSIGDYVLAGGEAAVLVIVEAVGRLLPGVLGNADSVTDDSFAAGAMETLLEGPVYTKPPVWRDRAVPEILMSGHHGAIARWRRDQALRRTVANRPELVARLAPEALDEHDRQVLRDAGFPVDDEPTVR